MGLYDRATDRARKIGQLANQQANALERGSICTEHLLLGLLIEGSGVGFRALENLGVKRPLLRAKVKELGGIGPLPTAPHKLPLTDKASSALTHAREEAESLGHDYLGSEHILLGLLRQEDGVAATVLSSFGVTIDAARKEIMKIIAG